MKDKSMSLVLTSSGEVCCVIMASKKSYMYCTKTITKIIQGQVHKAESVEAELVNWLNHLISNEHEWNYDCFIEFKTLAIVAFPLVVEFPAIMIFLHKTFECHST